MFTDGDTEGDTEGVMNLVNTINDEKTVSWYIYIVNKKIA